MDIIVVAEKSRGVNLRLSQSIIEEVKHESDAIGARLGLVVYSRRPLPLVDLPGSNHIDDEYDSCPILDGRPEPVLGILEAYEMLQDYKPVLPTTNAIILLWSATVRPRIPFKGVFKALHNHGIAAKVIILRPSAPKWLPRVLDSGYEADKIRFIRKNTNIHKLVTTLIKEIQNQKTL
ncbi:MAG: hypothetical protein F7C07_02820 [Desulfurococcales archaeon]|nr:hypothetical protein [Desulfurococcales archaeon]